MGTDASNSGAHGLSDESPRGEIPATRDRLHLVLDAADLGYFELDLATDTTSARSLRHDQIFGYAALQRDWGRAVAEQHVVEEDRPAFRKAFADALDTGRLAVEVRARWPDGSVHWISANGRTYYDGAGRPVSIAGVVADITARKAAEAALRAAEARQAFLVRLGDALRPLDDPAVMQTAACRLLVEALSADRASFGEFRTTDGIALYRAGYAREGIASVAACRELADFDEVVAALRTGEPCVIDDTEASPLLTERSRAAYRALGMRAFASVPLLRAGDVAWTLNVNTMAPRAWSLQDIALLREVAERTWDTAERARAVAALRVSEELHSLALDAAGMGIFVRDLDEGRIEADERALELAGLNAYGPRDRRAALFERIHPEDRDRHTAAVIAATNPGSPGLLSETVHIVLPDGRDRWLSIKGRTTFAGEPRRAVRIAGVVTDVTDIRQSSRLAEESQERLRLAQAVSGIGVFDQDMATGRIVWSEEQARIYGVSLADIGASYEGWCRLLLPEDLAATDRQFTEGVAKRTPRLRSGFRIRRPDGEIRHIEAITSITYDEAGTPLRLLGVNMDVTDRARAVAALAESEERLRLSQEAARVGFWDLDIATGRVVCSAEYCLLFGLDPGGPGHRTVDEWLAQLHPGDRDRVRADAAAARVSGRYETEYRILLPDGRTRSLMSRGMVRYDGSRRPVRFIGLVADVTALRESELRMRLAIEGTGFATWDHDVQSGKTVWSANHFTLFGYEPDPTGRATYAMWEDCLHPEDRDSVRNVLQAARQDEPFRIAYRIRRVGDRAERWMESFGCVVESMPDGPPLRRLGVTMDITERQKLEAELRQAQKLQALGQLAGGVAHDFNNVLQAVTGGVRLLLRQAGDADAVRRYAAVVLQSADRAAAITRRLLVLARRGELHPEQVDAAALLGSMRDMLASAIGPGIRLRLAAPSGLPPLLADQSELQTALINLATNGRDAMPDGGTLSFEVEAERHGADTPSPPGPGAWIRIAVRDTGVGMDPATLSRALEPFFSTKPVGQGTGLGLPMVKGFVEQSGGSLVLDSKVGQGTTVTLWLPQAGGLADGREAGAEAEPSVAAVQRIRVLVVDDEEPVRETLAEELDYLGCTVTTAASGLEGLARLDESPAIQAMIADLAMPGMDGLSLIQEARKRRPGLPVVLLTGYAGDIAEPGTAGTEAPFRLLSKPSSGTHIVEALTDLLGARPGERVNVADPADLALRRPDQDQQPQRDPIPAKGGKADPADLG
ncbi:PAS domain-containing protein [Falsiroseomonas sp. HW251]|uniref:PAS domain-containing protein n=1 Tax=Falsiroseomonas sp. HW251 TaxID=3390998 RepID=UPI003D317151